MNISSKTEEIFF